jgi:hypothetical protein
MQYSRYLYKSKASEGFDQIYLCSNGESLKEKGKKLYVVKNLVPDLQIII